MIKFQNVTKSILFLGAESNEIEAIIEALQKNGIN